MKPQSRENAVGDKTVPVSQHANAPLFPLIHTHTHTSQREKLCPNTNPACFFVTGSLCLSARASSLGGEGGTANRNRLPLSV